MVASFSDFHPFSSIINASAAIVLIFFCYYIALFLAHVKKK